VGISYGIAPETIAQGIAQLRAVPGRFERVDEGQPFVVVVDYAHTDDALRNVIAAARGLNPKRVITLFGCGGDRGGRWLHTPGLGIHYAQTDTAGNVVVGEDRIRYAMEVAAGDPVELYNELQVALGAAWDEELEPFRHAGDDASVVWLHKVG
jgi:UDP-N-acetylmuramyl tripeptide synthase